MTDLDREVWRLRNEHYTNPEIAKQLGISASRLTQIVTVLRAMRLAVPTSRAILPAQEVTLRELWSTSLTVEAIGVRMGLTKASVQRYRRVLNLPNRRDARAILALLTTEEQRWLHEQANGGLTINELIAAIVRDAYAEEMEE